jgi:hypothetical protein
MILSTIPFFVALAIFWAASKIDLGGYPEDSYYNILVPQENWYQFKIFLVVLLSLSVPAWLSSTYAKYKNKNHKMLYPHSQLRGWTSNLDEVSWEVIQVVSSMVLIFIGIIFFIFV